MSHFGSLSRRQLLQATSIPLLAAQSSAQRPNILYLNSHDTGRYLQPYGHPVPAPNLQRLADQGMLFRQAFNAAPTCSPSRAALLTGQCPHSSGMLGLAHRGFALNDYRQHLIHTLRPAGYRSVLAGVQHVAKQPSQIGYDEVLKTRNTQAAEVAPAVVSFLDRKPQQPFFLEVGFFETHREFPEPGPREDPRFCEPPPPLPDTPRTRKDMAAYKASARIMDDAAGQILNALDRNGLAANTLVIYTTDHGIAFPGMKCNLTDHGMAVSLIMRGPGGFRGGRVCDAMVSQIDLFPTICDLVNVPKPAWLQGHSLMPLVRDEARQIREELFGEVTYHAAYEPKRAVRTHRYRYVRNFGGRRTPVLPNCDDSPSKDVWMENGWRNRLVPEEELYDLIFDPNETRNLASDDSLTTVKSDLRARLDKWMKATDDPLLKGPVKPPAGATFNDPDGVSPKEPVLRS